jgi:protein dithiol oxidoreductase (disulfide-forming)
MTFRLFGLLMLAASSLALAQAPFQTIDPPQPTASGERIEVIEVFAYTCPACAIAQPRINAWKANLPADVEFTYMPAAWGGPAELYARAFYAADALGMTERTHDAMYDAIHVQRRAFRGEDDIVAFYAEHGADAEEFRALMKSFGVTTRINRSRQQMQRFGVEGTPTMVVNGKYRIALGEGGPERMLEVTNERIAAERSGG